MRLVYVFLYPAFAMLIDDYTLDIGFTYWQAVGATAFIAMAGDLLPNREVTVDVTMKEDE